MAHACARLVRSTRNCAMRTLVAGAALGTILVASVAAAAPGAATPRTLVTRGSVTGLAADGNRAALIVRSRNGCAGVVGWEPARRRVVQLQHPCRYRDFYESTNGVALAGTRAAWVHKFWGHSLEAYVTTATLRRPTPAAVDFRLSNADGGYGDFARAPAGDGNLLAFTLDRRCEDYEDSDGPRCPPGHKTGDVIAATIWRLGGHGRCPDAPLRRPVDRRCTRVAQADGELSVLAVDAGRIAVRTDNGVSLLTASGYVLREFDLTARQAALSANRLAMRTKDAIEIYDTSSGQRIARVPAANHLRLEDLDRDILVTALGPAVTLRKLGGGQTSTIRVGGIARAQLERPGLFVAGERRVTFTPMRDVLRQLGD